MLTPAVTRDSSQLLRLDSAAPARGSRKPLFGLDAEALEAYLEKIGQPAWRGRQLATALYRQWVAELSDVSTLPRKLRRELESLGWAVGRPQIVQIFRSVDGTERYLIQSQNGNGNENPNPPIGEVSHRRPDGPRSATPQPDTVETVWMPEGDGVDAGDEPDTPSEIQEPSPAALEPVPVRLSRKMRSLPSAASLETGFPVRQRKTWKRATVCVSSQVGCAVNCQFCLTARLGLQRNLGAGEIAGQVVAVLARHGVELGRDRVNLVFMGMGEPFLNYDNFMAAVRLLVREVGLSPQRMTVSTSGIVPGIEQFALEPPELRPRLAISLNAPNDQVRTGIMPINRKWPIQAVIDAARQVRLRPRERITFEYVLLGGVTDRPEHAKEVARLVRRSGLPAKVNLIAWNPGPGIGFSMPTPESVEIFQEILAVEGIPVYLRQPRGRDIYAACGQLKRTLDE
jgi:23S rRNA (adenine2503-C2)-methyltransferase